VGLENIHSLKKEVRRWRGPSLSGRSRI